MGVLTGVEVTVRPATRADVDFLTTVVIEATHACMTARGVRTPGVTMTTSRMMGVFRDDERSRKEVLALMGKG